MTLRPRALRALIWTVAACVGVQTAALATPAPAVPDTSVDMVALAAEARQLNTGRASADRRVDALSDLFPDVEPSARSLIASEWDARLADFSDRMDATVITYQAHLAEHGGSAAETEAALAFFEVQSTADPLDAPEELLLEALPVPESLFGGTMPVIDGMVCPVGGAFSHVNDWHFPRGFGRVHKGNDLFAARHTPLLAAADGTILKVDRTDTYAVGTDRGDLGGRTVTIADDIGRSWYYAHLETVMPLAVGDRVVAGQQIGTVGNSGNAKTTPTHVHLGVYANGTAQTPYPIVASLCGTGDPAAPSGVGGRTDGAWRTTPADPATTTDQP